MKTLAMTMWPFVVVAFAVCPVWADDKRDEAMKKADAMLEKALKAYNDNDAAKFYADFVKNQREREGIKDHFAIFFHDDNKEKFGKYMSRKMIDNESLIIEDQMVLHYTAVFEKNKKARIMAALGKEGADFKFKLIDFSVME